MKEYTPIELARMFNMHPNTIRFYESIGCISKAERKPNGYRKFTDKHILQLEICRYIYGHRYTNHRIREAGYLIINAAANDNLTLGKQYASNYISIIQNEIDKAEKTNQLLYRWANLRPDENNNIYNIEKSYTRKEIADLLGVTSEAVRNWERNYLVKSNKRGNKNEVLFNEVDFERMQIIYMLRQSGYSMSAIHRCLVVYDEGYIELLDSTLNKPEQDEILSAGDCWLSELKNLEISAKKIPPIFDELEKIIF